jgi:hypothetical protein
MPTRILSRILCVFLAASIAVTTVPPPPAQAQFGLKKLFKGVVRAPLRVLPVAPLVVFGGPFRSVFGVVAAVAIGSVIFGRLTKYERKEVARRAKVVVAKDPDQRVTDTYTSKDGTKQITIVAEPMQKAADLKNDPAIQVASDKVVTPPKPDDKGTAVASNTPPPSIGPASDGPVSDAPPAAVKAPEMPADKIVAEMANKESKPAAKPVKDEEVVVMSEIPPETQCRKVTTQLEIRKKKDQATADETQSNAAVFCQTAPGVWKPASA